ncbi:hypothetical protein CDAR_303771 [Caerostris darwini]|uniref:Uncharacterized protein n=2 Tax=Caerostris TaxID=172845 RepID=A0AAV4T7U8_9ARAC|nr:hypothetical protein CEXT_180141 [Caerostris extrusa]GIY41259.1 hypothetical protein CDAR_303771 [Caerostris darwini]
MVCQRRVICPPDGRNKREKRGLPRIHQRRCRKGDRKGAVCSPQFAARGPIAGRQVREAVANEGDAAAVGGHAPFLAYLPASEEITR